MRSSQRDAKRWKRRAATSVNPSQTPWQEIQRALVEQLSNGMVLKTGRQVPAHRPDEGHAAATTTS